VPGVCSKRAGKRTVRRNGAAALPIPAVKSRVTCVTNPYIWDEESHIEVTGYVV
jgi:hypothetical protein